MYTEKKIQNLVRISGGGCKMTKKVAKLRGEWPEFCNDWRLEDGRVYPAGLDDEPLLKFGNLLTICWKW